MTRFDFLSTIIYTSFIIISFGVIGVEADMQKRGESNEQSPSLHLTNGNNNFSIYLYKELSDQKGNLFFSPYSISTALAMTYAGARGKTASEMADVLQFTLPGKELHHSFFTLSQNLKTIQDRGALSLLVANGLWIQEGFLLKEGFKEITHRFYQAEPYLADFKPDDKREEARKQINQWVEKQTKDKISNLIPKGILDSSTRLVLTNAIYFKGDWQVQFNETYTKKMPFWILDNLKKNTLMMFIKHKFKYNETQHLQILELPYRGKSLSMVVILPKERFGLKQFEEDLNYPELRRAMEGLYTRDVRVSLPKFKTTCQFRLKEKLSEMGMPTAFGDDADFSGISRIALQIDEVIHKAFVEVNEEGTEAAASTAVIMKKRASLVREAVVFKADHPFIFLIKENQNNSILFMGRITNPD